MLLRNFAKYRKIIVVKGVGTLLHVQVVLQVV
jgi:hypothetical protein